ncbi:MAG TPA: zinc ribbon domain-containing protein [Anaerolineales bacterium]|nr:zinc ribbon domain-containing protein [Anaerolineales bacterium]
MDIASLLLLIALIIIVGAFVASPLRVRRGAVGLRQEDHEISELLAERERVLESLEELDLDNAMGKVPENVYPIQRDRLVKRGVEVLRLLDQYTDGQIDSMDSAVSTAVDPLEAMIAARKAGGQPAAVRSVPKPAAADNGKSAVKFCPKCGSKLESGDRFCAECGEKL